MTFCLHEEWEVQWISVHSGLICVIPFQSISGPWSESEFKFQTLRNTRTLEFVHVFCIEPVRNAQYIYSTAFEYTVEYRIISSKGMYPYLFFDLLAMSYSIVLWIRRVSSFPGDHSDRRGKDSIWDRRSASKCYWAVQRAKSQHCYGEQQGNKHKTHITDPLKGKEEHL